MFSNQISTRDLYSVNENTDKGYSAERDFSQLQNAQFTQFESSQCSQDFFSQTQCSSGSAESQGRRLQQVEKYLAKPSLFRNNSQGKAPPSRTGPNTSQFSAREPQHSLKQQTSYQQQLNINKSRAKERDERDMLNSIVHIVKECSDEVKHNLHVLRDGEAQNSDKLKSSILSLTDQIKESSDKILKSVQSREEQVSMVEKLQKQLREKEDKIQELLTQQNSTSIQENSKSVVEAIRVFMTDQQNETDKRLQKLLDTTQEELKLLKEQMSMQRNNSDENNKNFQDMKYNTNRGIQDVEKRVVDELLHIRDDFERQKRDMESFYKNQLQMLQQKQTREITQHLDRGLESISKTSTDFDLLERQTEIVTEVCKTQQNQIVSAIKSVAADQSKQFLRQSQDLYSLHQKNIMNDLNRKFEDLKTTKESEVQKITDHIDRNLADRSREWKNDFVPKKVQAQLDELHNRHLSEIKRIEKEIEEQKKKAEEASKIQTIQQTKATDSGFHNVYDFQSEDINKTEARDKAQGPLFQRASGFLSPRPPVGTTWNSRAIFGRTNPSPVATVLPQRKSTADDRSANLVPKANSNMQQRDIPEIQPPAQPVTPDHVVPATPESARAMVQQSLANLIETNGMPKASGGGNVQVSIETESHEQTSNTKTGSRNRGRKKKKPAKKPKAKLKTYEQHQKITKTDSSIVRSTQALAVYDFTDEASPNPEIGKTGAVKQNGPLSVSGQSAGSSSIRDRNRVDNDNIEQQYDDGLRNTSLAPPNIDVFVRRKVGQMDRKSPVKPEKPHYTGQSFMCQDFLSTPYLTSRENNVSEAMNIHSNRNSLEVQHAVNKNTRRSEPKRRLCDFDSQIVNLLECIQKRKKLSI